MESFKTLAVVGANRDGLSLLPLLLNDKSTKVVMIADDNKDAMAFKLGDFGYKLADNLNITLTSNLDDLKKINDIDTIIDASADSTTSDFLSHPEFCNVEVLSSLSARLIWGYKGKDGKVREDIKKTTRDRQSSLLDSLAEIVDAVKLTLDKKELLSLILKLAMDTTGADKGSLMLLDSEEKVLKVEVAEGMEEEIMRKVRVPVGEGITGWIAKEGKPLIIRGVAADPRFKNLMKRSDVKSALCVPLNVGNNTIGVLNLSSSTSSHAFTKDDLSFLSRLAAFDAEIIQRSQEYEEMKHSTIKFNVWKEVEAILAKSGSLEERLKEVCGRMKEFVQDLSCSIYIYDENSKKLFLKASTTREVGETGPFNLDLNEGIGGWVASEKKGTILVEKERVKDSGYRKYFLSFPLLAEDSLVGIIEGQLVSSSELADYQESFLQEITAIIAESIKDSIKDHRVSLHSTKLSLINDMGLEIVTASDEEKLPSLITSSAAIIMDAGKVALRVKDALTNRFVVKSLHGLDQKEFKREVLPYEKELSLKVLQEKKPSIKDLVEECKKKNGDISSLLSYPLMKDDTVLGIITLINKEEKGQHYPASFNNEDLEVFSRFTKFSEKALANIAILDKIKMVEAMEGSESFNSKNYFERRLKEELNRAKRYGRQFLIMFIDVANFDEYNKERGGKKGLEAMKDLSGLVEQRIRSFDVVGELEKSSLGVLFPDSDVGALRIVDQISKIGKEGMDLRFGYAIYPDDAKDYDELLERARP